MSVKKCIALIKSASASGKITDSAAMDILDGIEKFKLEAKHKNLVDLDGALLEHIKKKYNESVFAATIEKRNRVINMIAEAKTIQRIRGTKLDSYDALRALLGGVTTASKGSKLSIDAEGKALANGYIGRLIQRLEEHGDLPIFNSGKMDKQIAQELWEIREDGTPGSSGSDAAMRIAEVIHDMQEIAIEKSNRYGSYIRSAPGYIMKQSHDQGKLFKAGMDQWINDIWDKLDDELTFGDADKREFLEGAYKGLVSGWHRRYNEGEQISTNGFKGPQNLAKKASAQRILHFKSAEAFMEYNGKFGAGDLREGVVYGLEHMARNTALMKNLGTNPRHMFDRLVDKFQKEASKANNINLMRKLSQGTKLDNLFAEIDGTTRIPVNIRAARINAVIRVIQNVSKLGGATISSVTDIPNQAAELRYQGNSVFAAYGNAFASLFRGRGVEEQKIIARSLGIGFDTVTGDLMSRFHANDHVPGTAAKLQQKFFKLNLMGWWNDSHRTGVGLMMSNNMAEVSGSTWGELNPRLSNVLNQYDIGAPEWEVFRKFGVIELDDGYKYMTADGIEAMETKDIRAYGRSIGKRYQSERQVEEARDELVSRLMSFFLDRVDHAIPMPGAAERSIMNQGTRAGSVSGEMWRHIMQFKSFPITMIRRGVGREVNGQENGKTDVMGLAQLIAMGTVFGYSAMYMKDILKGRTPRTFKGEKENDVKLILAALTQGGGLGIYGDFLFGEFSRFGRSALSTAAGPTLGQVDTVAELFTRITRGKDFGATAFQVAKDNTPFVNLFYTRLAFDYLILFQIQEMTNPGYLRRLERRIMSENDQKYFIPPSKQIPYGGGNKPLEGVF